MAVLFANNATGSLAASVDATQTSISLQAGEGAAFPSPSGSDWFPLTLIQADGTLEIVRCTERTDDLLTVQRAQEGTSAKTFSAGDRVGLRLTIGAITEFLQANQNLADLASAATARDNLGLGSAAVQDVGTATGNLMEVGAFGLGADAVNLLGQDFDTVTTTGFYRSESSPNAPSGGHQWKYLLVIKHNGSYVLQHAWDFGSTPRAWYRAMNSDTWSAWRELYHTENLDPSIYAKSADLGTAANYDDSRYLRQDVSGSINGGLTVQTNYRVRASGNRHMWFEDEDGNEQGLIWHDATNGRIRMRLRNGQAGTQAELILKSDGDIQVLTGRFAGPAGGLTGLNTSAVNAAISGSGHGQVGTYALLRNETANFIQQGDTVAGSNLLWSTAYGGGLGSPSGTWRAMGRAEENTVSENARRTTVFLRIS